MWADMILLSERIGCKEPQISPPPDSGGFVPQHLGADRTQNPQKGLGGGFRVGLHLGAHAYIYL